VLVTNGINNNTVRQLTKGVCKHTRNNHSLANKSNKTGHFQNYIKFNTWLVSKCICSSHKVQDNVYEYRIFWCWYMNTEMQQQNQLSSKHIQTPHYLSLPDMYCQLFTRSQCNNAALLLNWFIQNLYQYKKPGPAIRYIFVCSHFKIS